jgi:hypothetical protein
MTTERFLTEEDKTASLLVLKSKLTVEIEKILDEMAIDKSSFSTLDYKPVINRKDDARYLSEQTLYRHCQVMKSIDKKIEELRNV